MKVMRFCWNLENLSLPFKKVTFLSPRVLKLGLECVAILSYELVDMFHASGAGGGKGSHLCVKGSYLKTFY